MNILNTFNLINSNLTGLPPATTSSILFGIGCLGSAVTCITFIAGQKLFLSSDQQEEKWKTA